MNRFWKYYFAPIFWAAFIFWNSSRSHIRIPNYFFHNLDKIIHFGVYLVLGYLITRAFSQGNFNNLTRKIFSLSTSLGVLYGLSDEFHQMFVPGRSMDLLDLLADIVGIVVAQVVIYFYYQKLQFKQSDIDS